MKNDNDDNDLGIYPLQVKVGAEGFSEAVRRFKSLFQKERIIGQLKDKAFYEKPSEKKRRKRRETAKRNFLTQLREKQIASGEWQKRQKKKEQKRKQKQDEDKPEESL